MQTQFVLFAQQGGLSEGEAAALAGMASIFLFVWLGFVILMIASWWVIFTKAGKPGWASIIPIYNVIVMLEIAGKPVWWILLLLIPIVNLIILLIILYSIVENFGQGFMFFLGVLLLGIIFIPILAFGDAKYIGPRTS